MRRSARYLAAVLLATYILYGAAPARAALGDCGQPVSTGITVTASDALRILLTAVGSGTCTPVCICDVNAVGGVTATDALLVLQRAVGQNIVFACPCANTSTTSTSTTSSTTSTTMSTTTTTLAGQQPGLTAGDFPSVHPCSDRDTLPNNAAFLAVINAASTATMIVNFTQYDTAGLPEICGLTDIDNTLAGGAVSWDPSRQNVFDVCQLFKPTVPEFFTNVPLGHGPDLCQTGNDTMTVAMPRAGVYRKDACIEDSGNAYDVRTRITVSGPSVDATLASLGVTRSDLHVCDGGTEILTQADAKAFATANPTDMRFSIRSGSCSGTDHLEVQAEIICVNKRTSACPPTVCF